MKDKVFFENLDGLRFLCFLSVFFCHSFHTNYDYISTNPIFIFIKKGLFSNGNLGVNFFFVLSGFLITFLLIKEVQLRGRIDVVSFWKRRILRIWPLFYACILFGFFAFPIFKGLFGQQPQESANIFYYLTFTNNFDVILNGEPDASVLSVLWSVAIEEQFYLFWPLILFFIPTTKYWVVFMAIMLTSIVFRANTSGFIVYEKHTLSVIGDMATGGLGAWLILHKSAFLNFIENLSKWFIATLYLLFGIIFIYRGELIEMLGPIYNIFERGSIAFLILFIILEQNYAKNSLFKMKNFKFISQYGKLTYGLYCLHMIAILIVTTLTNKLGINTQLWQVLILETVAAFVLSILIAKISYNYLEMPFLKIKEKFAYITK